MYFEQTDQNPEQFALMQIKREDAEMLVQAILALKEANYMDTEEFANERRKLEELYKQMNSELVRSRHSEQTKVCWAKLHRQLIQNRKCHEQTQE